MTTKFISKGEILTFTAPSGGVTSGVPVAIGSLVVVPQVTAAEGESFSAIAEGVVQVTKVGSQAWTEGLAVFWDAGDTRFTATAADGVPAGVATAAVGSGAGATTGYVKLNAGASNARAATVAALAGSLTGTVDGTLEDVAAVSTAGGNTYADSAINTAITAINLQLKELQTTLNATIASLKAAGLMA